MKTPLSKSSSTVSTDLTSVSPHSMEEQQHFDVVILGASGFTGKYVLREFLHHRHRRPHPGQPYGIALAGRSIRKLAQALTWASSPSPPPPLPLLHADAHHPPSLHSLCSRTRVVLNCVGPYNLYGEPIVAACVQAGVHYVDVSGEAEFMEKMEAKYHEKAKETGSLIVPGCGSVSIISDIGLLFHLRQWEDTALPNSVDSYLHNISSKSFVLNATSVETAILGLGNAEELSRLRKSRPRRPKLTVPGTPANSSKSLHYEDTIGLWSARLPISDAAVVRRSFWTLAENPNGLPALEEREEEIEKRRSMWARIKPVHYGVFLGANSFRSILLFTWATRVLTFLARYRFGRTLLLRYPEVFTGGIFTRKGPTEEEVQSASFQTWFVGRGYSHRDMAGGGKDPDMQVVTRMSGPESAYRTTSIAVVQSALLCVEQRRSLPCGGVLTTAAAFGASDLQERLEKCGVCFELIDKKRI